MLDWLYVAAGGEEYKVKRTNQASSETADTSGFGRIRMRPWGSLELVATGGRSHIDAGDYTVNPAALPENPLLRKYNQSNRDRDFAEARLSWSPWKLSRTRFGAFSVPPSASVGWIANRKIRLFLFTIRAAGRSLSMLREDPWCF